MANENMEHLGDGVYAEFDGYAVNIRVNDHRNPVAVQLEPDVLKRLVPFYERQVEMATKKVAETTKKNLWWGYKHVSGTYQAKRYFEPLDITEAIESPMCEIVTQPFEAENREDAIEKVKKLTN